MYCPEASTAIVHHNMNPDFYKEVCSSELCLLDVNILIHFLFLIMTGLNV